MKLKQETIAADGESSLLDTSKGRTENDWNYLVGLLLFRIAKVVSIGSFGSSGSEER